ncbi:DUF692 domain-containing protein [Thalassotalea euphylliae]|uniref:DUF692 domain-containing protein n=1 Tax=Thalassotalea euphylliae TaxID=1655234 RepID=A0A3E0UK87_9GAMM|nr:DUF692 domain-containing protein [Thalassotalea euphylliae]REL37339.1 DUF692 domain-containing protein [Thalassotalea euphylliae]
MSYQLTQRQNHKSISSEQSQVLPLIGVGLRHVHYQDALTSPFNIDFVEVHVENFFAKGGITQAILNDIKAQYAVSLHATSLGLGSTEPVPEPHLKRFSELVEQVQPILVSDHACFSWGQLNDLTIHAGDLLPVPFNQESLAVMVANVNKVQQQLGRRILVENLSAYITPANSTMSESEFLIELCRQTDCRLLLDLNNLMVNAINTQAANSKQNGAHDKATKPVDLALAQLYEFPSHVIGEIHLAGCSPVGETGVMIDDHSQPVSGDVWRLYETALTRFGAVPTLIEWDMDLPDWQTLCQQAQLARKIAKQVLPCH